MAKNPAAMSPNDPERTLPGFLCCGSEGDFGPLYTQTMVSRGNMRHVEGTGRSLRTLPLNRRRVGLIKVAMQAGGYDA